MQAALRFLPPRSFPRAFLEDPALGAERERRPPERPRDPQEAAASAGSRAGEGGLLPAPAPRQPPGVPTLLADQSDQGSEMGGGKTGVLPSPGLSDPCDLGSALQFTIPPPPPNPE